MTEVWVNGILVNAQKFYRSHVEIDYTEAERILSTVSTPRFEIVALGSNEELGLKDLLSFKEMTDVKFQIRKKREGLKKTADVSDIKFFLEQAGDECIAS